MFSTAIKLIRGLFVASTRTVIRAGDVVLIYRTPHGDVEVVNGVPGNPGSTPVWDAVLCGSGCYGSRVRWAADLLRSSIDYSTRLGGSYCDDQVVVEHLKFGYFLFDEAGTPRTVTDGTLVFRVEAKRDVCVRA